MSFPSEVTYRLNYYVYRLIDPRNAQTFYVGKGKGNRVFAHAKAKVEINSDDEKLKRITEIKKDGFEVAHIIHRHGLDENTALEVEAALIDAYPEASNSNAGLDSAERGLMHADQVIKLYQSKEIDVNQHKLLMINVNRSTTVASALELNVYEAVRFSWKLDVKKAQKSDFVLALRQGLVIGVFVPKEWLKATEKNFPGKGDSPGRFGFVGEEASSEIKKLYLKRRIPDSMRKKGAANPIRYSYK